MAHYYNSSNRKSNCDPENYHFCVIAREKTTIFNRRKDFSEACALSADVFPILIRMHKNGEFEFSVTLSVRSSRVLSQLPKTLLAQI